MFGSCCVDPAGQEEDAVLDMMAGAGLSAVRPIPEILEPESEKTAVDKVAPEETPPAASSTFTVEFKKSENLGLHFDSVDEDTLIIKDVGPGLVENWNKTCPADQLIKANDHVKLVNGKSGRSADLINRVGGVDDSTISFTLQKPREREISLGEPGDIGISISFKKTSSSLMIKDITDGLLKKWNAAHPEDPINAKDRITAVDGISGKAEDLLKLMKGSKSKLIIVTLVAYKD
jgi:hypothetical protein